MFGPLSAVVLAALLTSRAAAHSWIEQMQVIGSNGSYVGDYGYPRGYIARTEPGFGDDMMVWRLPPSNTYGQMRINGSETICRPEQQSANYNAQYPKLSVSPGDFVAMKYQENGHVSQPWTQQGKPFGGGTVFVYGTYYPDPSTKLVDVLQWNTEGTGGDGKGFLMTAQNFDDERCHELSDSPISLFRQQTTPDPVPDQPGTHSPQWCETDLQIPEDIKGSSLTAYWIWQWPTAVGTPGMEDGKDEYYTTCLDFDVFDSSVQRERIALASKVNTLLQQDPQTTAPSYYRTRTAKVTSASYTTQNLMATAVQPAAVTATTSPLPTTHWSIPAAQYTSNGTTYELENMGTVLKVNGQMSAYVNCLTAVTTGSVSECPTGAPAASTVPATTPTSTPAAVPMTSLTTTPAATPSVPAPTTPVTSIAITTTAVSGISTAVTSTAMTTLASLTAVATTSTAPESLPSISPDTGADAIPTIYVPTYATGVHAAAAAPAPSATEQPAMGVQAKMGGTASECSAAKLRQRHARDFRLNV